MKALVLFYSMYGHIYQMAQAALKGLHEVDGTEADIKRVPETLGDDVLSRLGAIEARKAFEHVDVCTVDELPAYDLIVFGAPTRFGSMCGQMRQFLDATGGLWARRALVGKVGCVFTSSGTQHGGQESTILSFHITLLHHGMVVVGLPYTFDLQSDISEITGCSPYGASTIAGPDGKRMPSTHELTGARFLARHAAGIAMKLKG
jgi:NAD(P)H dehydrogenase (quinone)